MAKAPWGLELAEFADDLCARIATASIGQDKPTYDALRIVSGCVNATLLSRRPVTQGWSSARQEQARGKDYTEETEDG